MDLKEVALNYLVDGLCPMPVQITKSKRPAVPSWTEFQKRPPTVDEIKNFFSDKSVDGIGVICGKVSGNLEVIDFDNKLGNIKHTMGEWSNIPGVGELLASKVFFVEKTQRKGYHIIYRCPEGVEGSQKLALVGKETIIETRGEGGFIVTAPTPGYSVLKGSLSDIPVITVEERNLLINAAKSFDQERIANPDGDASIPKDQLDMDQLLMDEGWTIVSKSDSGGRVLWCRPGKSGEVSATMRPAPDGKCNIFYPFTTSVANLQAGKGYGPVGLYAALKCGGDLTKAKQDLGVEEKPPEGIIRVGDTYYEFQQMPTLRNETPIKYWASRARLSIMDDLGKARMKLVRKYHGFVNFPDNKNYRQVIDNFFNVYHEFPHQPVPGEWPVTESLLRQVFGDQYEIGLDYIHLLYHEPGQILPVLCLVSPENQTGKTTFLNWLNYLFGDNMVIIGYSEIMSDFNRSYATRLIIAIEESLFNDPKAMSKLKAMATQDKILVNEKWVAPVSVEFFGKLILTSNFDDEFVNASDHEVRFWVRRLVPIEKKDPDLMNKLRRETPAFVDYIQHRAMTHKKVSRMWFSPEDLETDQLRAVKMQSKSKIYREILERLTEYFDKFPSEEVAKVTPIDFKEFYFQNVSNITVNDIRRCIKNEFKLSPDKPQSYFCLQGSDRMGRPFIFNREEILKLQFGDEVQAMDPSVSVDKEIPIKQMTPTGTGGAEFLPESKTDDDDLPF